MLSRMTAAMTPPSMKSAMAKDSAMTMRSTTVKLLDTCLRRISHTDSPLAPWTAFGPSWPRRRAASAPLRPWPKLVLKAGSSSASGRVWGWGTSLRYAVPPKETEEEPFSVGSGDGDGRPVRWW